LRKKKNLLARAMAVECLVVWAEWVAWADSNLANVFKVFKKGRIINLIRLFY
jgi:hypothetical protein